MICQRSYVHIPPGPGRSVLNHGTPWNDGHAPCLATPKLLSLKRNLRIACAFDAKAVDIERNVTGRIGSLDCYRRHDTPCT